MVKRMQIFALLTFILVLVSVGFSQTGRPSDLKLLNLKGEVKSVVSTSKAISGYAEWVLKDKTKYQTTDSFDHNGNLTESLSEGQTSTKYVYLSVDGNKAFKMTEVKPSQSTLRVTIDSDNTPIEANEKRTEPEPSFDYKYIYEIGDSGRKITEKQYSNKGELFRKRIYEYNTDGILVKMFHEDAVAIMTFTYKYNSDGLLIEENETRDIKGAGTDSRSRRLYSGYKVDSTGNWIERKITEKSKTEALPTFNIPENKYTLVSVQTRTITYY